jgi:glycosyltransferase involved in cell wall biosynthesis
MSMTEGTGTITQAIEPPHLKVVVRSAGSGEALRRCLEALQLALSGVRADLVLIDDSLAGDLAETLAVAPIVLDVPWTYMRSDIGFRHALQLAIHDSSAPSICLVDDSVAVAPDSLIAMRETLDRQPRCGAVGALLLSDAGRILHVGGVVWNDGSRCSPGAGQLPGPEHDYLHAVDDCSAALLMLRRDALPSPLFVDPALGIAYADTELAFDLRQRGWGVLVCPRAVAVQRGDVREGRPASDPRSALMAEQAFLLRWQPVLAKDHYPPCRCLLRAREHAMGRRIVLVIDHYLPQPDRDAGSRAICQTIATFQAMGYLVKFWPANLHYDATQAALLADTGVEVVAGDRWSGGLERYLRYAGAELYAVLLSRPDVACDSIELVRAHSRARVLFYGHDLHHQRMALRAQVTGDAGEQRAADAMLQLEQSIWERVDAVLCPSAEEAAIVAAHVGDAKVHVVPLYHFDQTELSATRAPAPGVRLLFVAGFGHSPNVDAAQWLVHEILPRVRERLPSATLDLVGSNPTDEVRALAAVHGVRVSGSVSADVLHGFYRDATLAVVPLRFGAGVKLKVLEAMARGVPVVTTPVGAQGLPGVGTCIDVADDPGELASAMMAAVEHPDPAAIAAARDYVHRHYGGDGMRQALERVLSRT